MKTRLAHRLWIRPVLLCIVALQFFVIILLSSNSRVSQQKVLSSSEASVISLMKPASILYEAQPILNTHNVESTPSSNLPKGWTVHYSLRNLVNAFVSAKIDWHFLSPGITQPELHEGVKFEQLLKKEATVINTLLDARDKPIIGPIDDPIYNPDFKFCSKFNDKCVIHRNKGECLADGFCSWCGSINMCTERYTALKPDGLGKGTFLSLCPDFISAKKLNVPPPVTKSGVQIGLRYNKEKNFFEAHGSKYFGKEVPVRSVTEPIDPNTCKNIIYGTTVFGGMKWEGMYWHIIKSHLIQMVFKAQNNPVDSLHFVVMGNPDPVNFKWFSMLTKSCVRTMHDIPDGTCFQNAQHIDLFQPREGFATWSAHVLNKLELTNYPPASMLRNRKPVLGLISRHNKRIILNEPDLVRAAKEIGFDVRILMFDTLTIEEQIMVTRECDVLMGIHGSGMLNEIFMRKNTYSIQVVPYGLPGKAIESAYGEVARLSGLKYKQFDVRGKENAVIHWHFAEDIWPDRYIDDSDNQNGEPDRSYDAFHFKKSQVLERGSAALPDTTIARVLMVQQDAIIPLHDFKPFMKEIYDELSSR
jgi:hypothetical protein